MNTCVLLVIAIIVVTTAAQDLPNSFTSTEINQAAPSANEVDSIFKDEEVIEYSRIRNTDQVNPSGNDLDDIFGDDEVIEYSTSIPINKARNDSKEIKTSDRFFMPSLNRSYEVDFEDWDTTNSVAPNNDNDLQTSNRIPAPTLNRTYELDFDDWDMMNADEDTLFAEFNQTLLNEMKKNNTQPSTTTRPTTARPSVFTTPLVTLLLDANMFDSGEDETTKQTTPLVEPDSSEESVEITTTEPTSQRRVDPDKEDITKTTVTPDNNGIVPYPDEPDYDSKEAKDDPCNYEKFEHPKPYVEKAGRRVIDIKCDEYMWHYKTEIVDVDRYRKECAANMEKKKLNVSQIFGGQKALQGDFPHMGAVGWYQMDGGIKWMCGSSLISPRFTLTAAHCRNATTSLKLKYTEPKIVRFGSVFLQKINKLQKQITARDIEIEQFLVLEEYAKFPIKKYNDIALIKLKEEVKMELFIKPACIRSGFVSNSFVANVAGWGQTSEAEGSESNHLRYAEVDFVDKSTCKRYIHGRKNRHWSEGLKDHQFCAGKLQGGIDACQGDSGGPLQIRHEWVPIPKGDLPANGGGIIHHVVGVTSFGVKCGYPKLPGVYTNITSFLCWIEKNVWPEEDNPFCP